MSAASSYPAFLYRDTSFSNASIPDFDAISMYEWMAANRWWMLYANASYILCILYAQGAIARLALSDLFVNDITLVWNSCNAIFNMYCTIALLPDFLRSCSKGWFYIVCRTDGLYVNAWSGRALSRFFWSKSWEFGDTILLIMRGRNVPFLHAYHHAVVLVQASLSYGNAGAVVRLGTIMNCFVLAIMYGYFSVVSIEPRFRRFAAIITILQLLQFVIGVFAILSALCYRLLDYLTFGTSPLECETGILTLLLNLAAYTTFVFLFCEYFRRCYLERRRRVIADAAPSTSNAKKRSSNRLSFKKN